MCNWWLSESRYCSTAISLCQVTDTAARRYHCAKSLILQHSDIIVPSHCYDIVALWSPRRCCRSWSYDSGRTVFRRLNRGVMFFTWPFVHLSVFLSICLSITRYFDGRMNLCCFRKNIHGASMWIDQHLGSGGQSSRSYETEVRFGRVDQASFWTLSVE